MTRSIAVLPSLEVRSSQEVALRGFVQLRIDDMHIRVVSNATGVLDQCPSIVDRPLPAFSRFQHVGKFWQHCEQIIVVIVSHCQQIHEILIESLKRKFERRRTVCQWRAYIVSERFSSTGER